MAMTPFIGVRISWLIAAQFKRADFFRHAVGIGQHDDGDGLRGRVAS